MFIKEDHTYKQMKKDSAIQWLTALLESEDVVNRQGAKVALEYIEMLNQIILQLEEKNKLKDEYLKKMKNRC